jgi:hypothetical protein
MAMMGSFRVLLVGSSASAAEAPLGAILIADHADALHPKRMN